MSDHDPDAAHVLVVDDNPMNAELAAMFLRRSGYKVSIAPSARTALACIETTPFAALLLDISMPEMSGTELCRLILDRLGERAPPMIAYTASAMPAEQASIIAHGFFAIALKPASRSEVVDKVRDAVAHYRRNRASSS